MKNRICQILILIFSVILFFFLKEVFAGKLILPQVFNLLFIHIRIYGGILALACITSFFVLRKTFVEHKITKVDVENLFVYLLLGGFLGARVWHVLTEASYYFNNPLKILNVWEGGLAIYGAIAGGLVALYFFKKKYLPELQYGLLLNMLAPSLIIGQAVGRFGNLFNYELFGFPTSLPWKMFVPESFRPNNFEGYQFFHPLFLYESLLCLLIYFALKYLQKFSFFNKPGNLFISYLLLYNVVRFFIEILRIQTTIWHNYKVNFLVFGAVFVICFVLFVVSYKNNATNTQQVP